MNNMNVIEILVIMNNKVLEAKLEAYASMLNIDKK